MNKIKSPYIFKKDHEKLTPAQLTYLDNLKKIGGYLKSVSNNYMWIIFDKIEFCIDRYGYMMDIEVQQEIKEDIEYINSL